MTRKATEPETRTRFRCESCEVTLDEDDVLPLRECSRDNCGLIFAFEERACPACGNTFTRRLGDGHEGCTKEVVEIEVDEHGNEVEPDDNDEEEVEAEHAEDEEEDDDEVEVEAPNAPVAAAPLTGTNGHPHADEPVPIAPNPDPAPPTDPTPDPDPITWTVASNVNGDEQPAIFDLAVVEAMLDQLADEQ